MEKKTCPECGQEVTPFTQGKNRVIAHLIAVETDRRAAHDRYITILKKSANADEFMMNKKDLLVMLLRRIPLDAADCIFCAIHEENGRTFCEKCGYAKVHGQCKNTDSTYRGVQERWQGLTNFIDNHYYKGTELENES